MNHKRILKALDHTLLLPQATEDDIIKACEDAMEYKTASVCIPPVFVGEASEYCKKRISVCTVVGFPNGYQTPKCKWFEAVDALDNGADEIDMVVCIGDVKSGRYKDIEEEIKHIKDECEDKILKVIIETGYLDLEEKISMCKTVTDAGADFIKTSTGFGTGGATKEDILLMKDNIGDNVKIKASGGIKTIEDAIMFLDAGASRLGSSSLLKLVGK